MTELSAELLEKIKHARRLETALPALGFRSMGELLIKRANETPDKIFLIYYGDDGSRVEFTYKDFYSIVSKTVNLLKHHGVKHGDRIATISHNHWETVVQYFAAWSMGAVAVPINIGEEDERIQYILENSQTVLAFVREPYLQRILPLKSYLPKLSVIVQTGGDVGENLPHFANELKNFSDQASLPQNVDLEDEVLIVYTSGTTGNPKGVVLAQQNLLADAQGISAWHKLTPEQRMMCVLPIHHVNGTIVTLCSPMFYGGSIVLNQKFNSKNFFERIEKERVHVVSVVPTLLQFLLHEESLDKKLPPPKTLRHIICGAGPLTVELAQNFEEAFHIPILHGYGLSETTCYSCFLPVDLSEEEHKRWLRDYGFPSIGVPIPQNEMEIHDEQGKSHPPDVKGEIVIRGINVMKYYFENLAANETTFAFGWFRSGDEGFYKVDSQGRKFFFITGRIKELIIRGGVNISPFEIDEVLATIQGIEKAMAVGFENDWYGEEVGAFVCLQAGAMAEAEGIIAECRKQLPYSKTPKVVVFGTEFPVTSTGKYQRNKCKHLFAEYKKIQFSERGSK